MRPRKIVFIAALVIGTAAYFLSGSETSHNGPVLETGDIIFRRENSFWGDMASAAARRDGRYSHAGIIYVKNNHILVVHAYADTDRKEAKVSLEPLQDFLKNATAAGYYRLNFPASIRHEVGEEALKFYKNKVPFDDKFSFYDDRAVYCTELVWRSVKKASGYDVAPVKSMLASRKFIGNDDLFLGGFMTELK